MYQELGQDFLEQICEQFDGKKGAVQVEDTVLKMEILAGDPRLNDSWTDVIAKADSLVVLVRFMDAISMEKVRSIFQKLDVEHSTPLSIVIVREPGEAEFKIACPECGQKLWVRDADAGKTGRCPNCKRQLRLMLQHEHLRQILELPEEVPVHYVEKDDPQSLKEAMMRLSGHSIQPVESQEMTMDRDVLNKTTVRIVLNDQEADS